MKNDVVVPCDTCKRTGYIYAGCYGNSPIMCPMCKGIGLGPEWSNDPPNPPDSIEERVAETIRDLYDTTPLPVIAEQIVEMVVGDLVFGGID